MKSHELDDFVREPEVATKEGRGDLQGRRGESGLA